MFRCYSGNLESSEPWVESSPCMTLNRKYGTMVAVGEYMLLFGDYSNNE